MKFPLYTFFIKLLTILMILLSFSELGASDYQVSKNKISTIRDTVQNYLKKNLDSNTTRKKIFDDLSEKMILEPSGDIEINKTSEITEQVQDIVEKKFKIKSAEDIEGKARKDFEEKYSMYQIGDYIEGLYEKSGRWYPFKGIYYGYGIGKRSIKVGNRYLSIFDLDQKTKMRVDKFFNDLKKNRYINRAKERFFTDRTALFNETYRKIKKKTIIDNENKGYIYYKNSWYKPKKLIKLYLNHLVAKQRADEIKRRLNKEKKTASATASTEDKDSSKQLAVADSRDEEIDKINNFSELDKFGASEKSGKESFDYAQLKQRAEKRREKIQESCEGIDLTQGYQLALWRMTKSEIKTLFYNYDLSEESDNMITINYEDKVATKVELYFYDDFFYKAIIYFNVNTLAGVETLWNKVLEIYGEPIEFAKMEAEGKKIAEEETVKDSYKEKKDEKKDKKKDKKKTEKQPMSREQVFNWRGKFTKGRVEVILNDSGTACELFTFEAESVNLKQELTAEKKAEKLRKKQQQKEEKKESEIEKIKDEDIIF